MAQSSPRRIAVLCLPGIGDALMATPLIALLKKRFPEAELDAICMFGAVAYAMKNNPNVDGIHTLSLFGSSPAQAFKQLWGLRKNRYDVSFLAYPAYRGEYHAAQWVIGAKRRIAHTFGKGYWRELNFLDTDRVAANEAEHNVENNLNLLGPLGISWRQELQGPISYDLALEPEDVSFGTGYLKDLGWDGNGVLGMHPGSTNSPAAIMRRWPIERFAEVAKMQIAAKRKVLVFVGPDEIELGDRLAELVGDVENLKVVRNLKFGQSLGVLSQVKALLCNDNGFGHLANGLGVPIVSLWASTFDIWSRPYDSRITTIIRAKDFQPWYRYDLKTAVPEGAESGIELIGVEEVAKAVSERMK